MSDQPKLDAAARALYENATSDKPVRKDWTDDNWEPAVRETWYAGAKAVLEAVGIYDPDCAHAWEEMNPGSWICKELCGAEANVRDSPDWSPGSDG